MQNFTQHLPNTKTKKSQTPQTKPIPGKEDIMVKNNAGGYSFSVDDFRQMERFLILGTEGGTYYVSEKKLTQDAAKATVKCIKADPEKVAQTIVAISDSGRAAKNDPAIFALALLASDKNIKARSLAYNILPKVCRIPTHLFHFVTYMQEFRGWGMGMRKAIAEWYHRWTPEKLAYEVVKYQSRDGFSNRDVLRLAHVKPVNAEYQRVFKWIVKGEYDSEVPPVIEAFEMAKKVTTAKEIVTLIRQFNLSREMIPTQFLKEASVWEALLDKMPITATIRSLAPMTACGLLDHKKGTLSQAVQTVVNRVRSEELLKKGRVHPVNILNALKTYSQGHGDKGKLTWEPVKAIKDALDDAFYLSFGAVEPMGKPVMLACDVSGSMSSLIAGTALSCRDMTAALALVTANVEKEYLIVGFSSSADPQRGFSSWGMRDGLVPLKISPKDRLDKVVNYMGSLPFGGTDCSLPMKYAKKEKLVVDAFIVLTDSETWAGNNHPTQALKDYRQVANRQSKMVVVGMTATDISIADPTDQNQLDVVGCDTNTPNVISTFVRG